MKDYITRKSTDSGKRWSDTARPSRASAAYDAKGLLLPADQLYFSPLTGERAIVPQPFVPTYGGPLKVASPHSRAEQEAERFASTYSSSPKDAGMTADSARTGGEAATLHASGADGGFELDGEQKAKVGSVLQESGQSLADAQQSSLGQALGKDLGHVRIHTGHAAEQAASTLRAKAFTVGRDIVFGKGEYRPGTKEGDHLLAHEMAHVAQGSNGIQRYALPTDWLDYIGLGIDVGERIYIELAYKPGEEKDFQRFVNTLFFAIDLTFAALPAAGGAGLAMRGSKELGAVAWHAAPGGFRGKIIALVAERMSWSVEKAGLMVERFFKAGGKKALKAAEETAHGASLDSRVVEKMAELYPGKPIQIHHWLFQALEKGKEPHPIIEVLHKLGIDIRTASWNKSSIPHIGGHLENYYDFVRLQLDGVFRAYRAGGSKWTKVEMEQALKVVVDEIKKAIVEGRVLLYKVP